jgi:glycosyltransferase involved in cell wall biosynthesis
MRVLFIIDALFATHERAMINRLDIGLVDEGLRIVHAIPQRIADRVPDDLISLVLTYQDEGAAITRPARARSLVNGLAALKLPGGEGVIDLVHAVGGASWSIAADVAHQTGAALAVDVWRAGLVGRARAIKATAGPRVVFFAPGPAIERALIKEGLGSSVRVARWGVHAPPEPRRLFRPDRQVSAVVSGAGRDADAFRAAIEGLALSTQAHENLILFVDAAGARRAGIWSVADRLGVLDRLTLVPGIEGRRHLALSADLFLQPGARGECHTLLLDAMAAGLPVIASADPMNNDLVAGRTAHLIEAPDPRLWEAAVSLLLNEPETAIALGASAREHVKEEHRVSSQIAAVLDGYEWLTSSDARE